MKDKIEKIPVYDKDKISHYDIFINGIWQGSRRTLEQCDLQIWWYFNGDVVRSEKEKELLHQKSLNKKEKENRFHEASHSEFGNLIREKLSDIIKTNEKQFLKSKENNKVDNWFVGQVMKELKGKVTAIEVAAIFSQMKNDLLH